MDPSDFGRSGDEFLPSSEFDSDYPFFAEESQLQSDPINEEECGVLHDELRRRKLCRITNNLQKEKIIGWTFPIRH